MWLLKGINFSVLLYLAGDCGYKQIYYSLGRDVYFMKGKIKIIIILIFTSIVLMAAITFAGFINNRKPEMIKKQEEYQMELIELLDQIGLLIHQDVDYIEIEPREEIAPGVEIFSERFALFAYCYRLVGRTENIATKEEIIRLYDCYDEALEEKFMTLYLWMRVQNGTATCRLYDRSLCLAYDLYSEQYGVFNRKESYSEMLIEDKTALEQFVRNNPDLMPKEKYYRELYNLFIISRDEFLYHGEAAEKSQ